MNLFDVEGPNNVYKWSQHMLDMCTPRRSSDADLCVKELLTAQKMGNECQRHIDRYLLRTWLHWTDTRLQVDIGGIGGIDNISALCIFEPSFLPDIGFYVRTILIQEPPVDVLGKFVQYSMPYIKHNRLTFPSFAFCDAQWLSQLILMLLGTCLGVYSKDSRKPTWENRVKIFGMLFTLLSQGSETELHQFCTANTNVIRMSIMEYYIYFVSNYMPVEFKLQAILFGPIPDVDVVFRQVRNVINNFRQDCLQSPALEWTNVNQRAQVFIEKCNRVCKSKIKIQYRREMWQATAAYSNADVVMALQLPKCYSSCYLRCLSETRGNVAAIRDIQKQIEIYDLSLSIKQQQINSVANSLQHNAMLLHSSVFLHVCLLCKTHKSCDMRIGFRDNVNCYKCNQSETVAHINMLGRLTRFENCFYHFCAHCQRVHAWQATGHNLSRCELNVKPLVPQCCFCPRSSNLHTFSVLHTDIATILNVCVCPRHMPFDASVKYIVTLDDLIQSVLLKNETCTYKFKRH